MILANSFAYIFIAIMSFVLGYKNEKHGLLHGMIFSIILIMLTLIVGNDISSISNIIKIITKTLLGLFFAILGVNKKNS